MNNTETYNVLSQDIFRVMLSFDIQDDRMLTYGFRNIGHRTDTPGNLHLSLDVNVHTESNKLGVGEEFSWIESDDTFLATKEFINDHEIQFCEYGLQDITNRHEIDSEDLMLTSNIINFIVANNIAFEIPCKYITT